MVGIASCQQEDIVRTQPSRSAPNLALGLECANGTEASLSSASSGAHALPLFRWGAYTLNATDPLLVHGGLPPLCGSGAPGAVGADAGGGQAGRQGSGGLSVGAPRGRHPQGQAESVPFARLLPVLVFLFGCALVVRSLRCA